MYAHFFWFSDGKQKKKLCEMRWKGKSVGDVWHLNCVLLSLSERGKSVISNCMPSEKGLRKGS
jgi:hypothetical protein